MVVDFGELHVDACLGGRLQLTSDVVGLNRQFAVAAVDQHGELDGPRPSDFFEGVEGGGRCVR